MIITDQAMYAIERTQRQAKVDHYQFKFELINEKLWLRIDFGDLFIPLPCPPNFYYATATLDYDRHRNGFFLLA